MFKKVLIANRGEIAVRVIRACKEWGIKTVAVHSDVDAESMHVRLADESVCIGSHQPQNSYLNISSIMSAVDLTGAEAIHPGYGFLSENAKFSEIVNKHGIKFIGPSAEIISKMGDKIKAKKIAKKFGLPVIEGSEGGVKSFAEAKSICKQIGYPVLIKAAGGGGGKGMKIVEEEKMLENLFLTAKSEAKKFFNNDELYIEKYFKNPRHIEVQVMSGKNKTVHLAERDCSVQRRHQKLIEETPSPFVDDKLREKMGQTAIKAGKAINYEGAGTIEFIVDKDKNFYFMEMNTRIQVEHGVTEEVTDFDLIKEQIKVTDGIKVSGKNYYPKLHAIECRINAEDPKRNFIPSPGKITNLHIPGGHGVRVDTHVYAGYTIPPNYDSMIAKIITTHQSRDEAIVRMKRALEEFVIEGIKTTIPLQLKLMNDKSFCEGNFTTKFLDDYDFKSI